MDRASKNHWSGVSAPELANTNPDYPFRCTSRAVSSGSPPGPRSPPHPLHWGRLPSLPGGCRAGGRFPPAPRCAAVHLLLLLLARLVLGRLLLVLPLRAVL